MRLRHVVPVLLLALLPAAQAATDLDAQPTEGPGCDNNGLIVMQGIDNRYSCTTSGPGCDNNGAVVITGTGNTYECSAQDSCHNRGVVATIGPGNKYQCDGRCTNTGIILNALGDHCGSDEVYVCAGRTCIEQDGAAVHLAPQGSASGRLG